MVRLKVGWLVVVLDIEFLCFNSIVVRLKVTAMMVHSHEEEKFQFHSGSIKSLSILSDINSKIMCFNSIVVRLKVRLHLYSSIEINCFNSIVVRLKEG